MEETQFKMRGFNGFGNGTGSNQSTSPLRAGCAPGEDCGNFGVNRPGTVVSRFLKKRVVDPIKRSIRKARVNRSNKEYNKRTDSKSNSKTSYQSPRTLSTTGIGGSDYK